MPKIIQTMCDVIPDEGLLVRSAYLRNDIRASSLISEARRRATELVARSGQDAEQVYQEAKTEGYAAGILQAAEALTQYLEAHAIFTSQLQAQLRQEVEALLRHCVSDEEVIMATFEACLKEQDAGGRIAGLELLLPARLRHNHRRLMQRLEPHVTGPVKVEYHQDSRFLLRFGNRVAEFSPDEFITAASTRAMRDLPSIYAENQMLAERCRRQLAPLFGVKEGDFLASAAELS